MIWLPAWLCCINIWTFLAFGSDKRRAVRGERRTSEADLLFYAAIGGIAGAYAGRSYFRHKTCKQPFSTQLHVVALLQCGAIIGWWAIPLLELAQLEG
jgi:uncharacterized membrane protein YsdA (DUF1294 family)